MRSVKRAVMRWIRYWIELVESIIGIGTLGAYHPWWSFHFMAWDTKRGLQKEIQKCIEIEKEKENK